MWKLSNRKRNSNWLSHLKVQKKLRILYCNNVFKVIQHLDFILCKVNSFSFFIIPVLPLVWLGWSIWEPCVDHSQVFQRKDGYQEELSVGYHIGWIHLKRKRLNRNSNSMIKRVFSCIFNFGYICSCPFCMWNLELLIMNSMNFLFDFCETSFGVFKE